MEPATIKPRLEKDALAAVGEAIPDILNVPNPVPHLLQKRVARNVVGMGAARQQNLDIGHLEAERLDRFFESREPCVQSRY